VFVGKVCELMRVRKVSKLNYMSPFLVAEPAANFIYPYLSICVQFCQPQYFIYVSAVLFLHTLEKFAAPVPIFSSGRAVMTSETYFLASVLPKVSLFVAFVLFWSLCIMQFRTLCV
jgi:hypothetical protein